MTDVFHLRLFKTAKRTRLCSLRNTRFQAHFKRLDGINTFTKYGVQKRRDKACPHFTHMVRKGRLSANWGETQDRAEDYWGGISEIGGHLLQDGFVHLSPLLMMQCSGRKSTVLLKLISTKNQLPSPLTPEHRSPPHDEERPNTLSFQCVGCLLRIRDNQAKLMDFRKLVLAPKFTG